MGSNQLTVSIIGAGNIAGGFDEKKLSNSKAIFTHAGAYSNNSNFTLKQIFDVDKIRASEFKTIWNVENVAKTEDDIIDNFQDIISICSPDRFHFETLKKILLNNSCKTVFVEKPLGSNIEEVQEIYKLSKQSNIDIVVNFQRRFDSSYEDIDIQNILSVNAHYVKGLNHIGITMIDTITMIFDYPKSVYSYNRVFNKEITEYSYEFILFYDDFTVSVKTIDKDEYNYHLFDIDIFTKDGRINFVDNGNSKVIYGVSDYAYSGVKVLTQNPKKILTKYEKSMSKSVEYLYAITNTSKKHTVNTVDAVLNNHILVEKIIESYNKEKKLDLEEKLWKR